MSLLTHPFSLSSTSSPLYLTRRQTETGEETDKRLAEFGVNPWAGIICNGTEPTSSSFDPLFKCSENDQAVQDCRNGSPMLDELEPYSFQLDNSACKTFCDNWHTGRGIDYFVSCLSKRCADAEDQKENWVKAMKAQPGANSTTEACTRHGFTAENATASANYGDDNKEETDDKDEDKEDSDKKEDSNEPVKDEDKKSNALKRVNWQGSSVLFFIVFGSIFFGAQ